VNPNNLTNEEVDARVRTAIRSGKGRAAEIESAVFLGETKREAMRAVDRALQRLRKRGHILLDGVPRRWKAVIP
jgi:hypothetical protein